MFRGVPECSGGVPGCSVVFRGVPGCSGVFRGVPGCSGVPVFRCSGVPVFLVLVHAPKNGDFSVENVIHFILSIEICSPRISMKIPF